MAGRLFPRILLRGLSFGLPSGQAVARAMGAEVLRPSDFERIGLTNAMLDADLHRDTPLWFYILHEADVLGDRGRRLGPVGGRIVAEVLLGILLYDRMSYLRQWPAWTPRDNEPRLIDRDKFRMTDLLQIAGMPVTYEQVQTAAKEEGGENPSLTEKPQRVAKRARKK